MIKGITYADEKMKTSAILCCTSMLKHGFDSAEPLGPYLISQDFKKDNWQYFYNGPVRGAGYWIWKPRVIWETMQKLNDGDILVYSDAGIEWVNSVRHLIDRMDENVFLFTNTHPNHHWTKRYTLDQMYTGWDKIYGADTPWPQVQASVIILKVCDETRDFIKEWLMWCQIPKIIDDTKGASPQYPFFQDHRHDQSVLTILASFSGYRLHWWPTQYSEHIRVPGDTYPAIFNHHRKRDTGHGEGQPEW